LIAKIISASRNINNSSIRFAKFRIYRIVLSIIAQ